MTRRPERSPGSIPAGVSRTVSRMRRHGAGTENRSPGMKSRACGSTRDGFECQATAQSERTNGHSAEESRILGISALDHELKGLSKNGRKRLHVRHMGIEYGRMYERGKCFCPGCPRGGMDHRHGIRMRKRMFDRDSRRGKIRNRWRFGKRERGLLEYPVGRCAWGRTLEPRGSPADG